MVQAERTGDAPFAFLSRSERWMQDAACAEVEPDVFHPEGHESAEPAKRICTQFCPVVSECLAYALREREEHGVWGGTSSYERKQMLLKRRAAA